MAPRSVAQASFISRSRRASAFARPPGGRPWLHVAAASRGSSADLLGVRSPALRMCGELVDQRVERGPGDPERLGGGLEIPAVGAQGGQHLVLGDLRGLAAAGGVRRRRGRERRAGGSPEPPSGALARSRRSTAGPDLEPGQAAAADDELARRRCGAGARCPASRSGPGGPASAGGTPRRSEDEAVDLADRPRAPGAGSGRSSRPMSSRRSRSGGSPDLEAGQPVEQRRPEVARLVRSPPGRRRWRRAPARPPAAASGCPPGWISRVSSARSSITWTSGGASPISSRNRVPPWARRK